MKKTIKSTLVLTLALALISASVVFATACGAKLESIEITTAPTITEYREGDIFNPAGMVVTAKYDNGDTEVVGGYEIASGGELSADDTSVTITYEGLTATQDITVSAKKMTLLAVTKTPDRISYKSSETFSRDGMKVTAVYDDGTTEEVSDYTLYPAARNLNTFDQTVDISYGGMTVSQPVVVTADSVSPATAPIVYKAVGSADVGGQSANINFEFRDNGMLKGILESGMGSDTDNMIAAILSFKGSWEQNGDVIDIKLNDFKFDPKTILGLVDMIPEEMMTPDIQAMIDSLAEMDVIDITGCKTTATVANKTISFKADLSAMGIFLPLECTGELPADMNFAAGEMVDAEFGDISGAKMKSGVPLVKHGNANRGVVVGNTALAGSVLKMNIDSAEAVSGADLTIHALANLKGEINDFFTLTINGKEVTLAGELASVTKYADLTATVDLIAGTNVIELIWKQESSAKIDFFTFSTAITLIEPGYGLLGN